MNQEENCRYNTITFYLKFNRISKYVYYNACANALIQFLDWLWIKIQRNIFPFHFKSNDKNCK